MSDNTFFRKSIEQNINMTCTDILKKYNDSTVVEKKLYFNNCVEKLTDLQLTAVKTFSFKIVKNQEI